MKKILENIVKSPVSTVKGILAAVIGLLTYYEYLQVEEGSLWLGLLLLVFGAFQKDAKKQLVKKDVNASIGDKGAVIPRKGF